MQWLDGGEQTQAAPLLMVPWLVADGLRDLGGASPQASMSGTRLAEAGGALIVGFNTVADTAARLAADRAGVEIKFYSVIYKLIDEMKLALEGLLKPAEVENIRGHAEIRAVFKSGTVPCRANRPLPAETATNSMIRRIL